MNKTDYERICKAIKSAYVTTCEKAKENFDQKMNAMAAAFPEFSGESTIDTQTPKQPRAPRLNVEEAIRLFLHDDKLPQDDVFTAADIIGWCQKSTGLELNRSSVVKALDRLSQSKNGSTPWIVVIEAGKGRKQSRYERNLEDSPSRSSGIRRCQKRMLKRKSRTGLTALSLGRGSIGRIPAQRSSRTREIRRRTSF
jgi:hypothetical protein